MDAELTPLSESLMQMAKHPQYTEILDTPGLAYHFNDFVKKALVLEKLVLDYWKYMDRRKRRGPKKVVK